MRNLLFITVAFIYLILNTYVCIRILKLLPAGNTLFRILIIGAISVGALGMFLFFMLGEKMPMSLATFLYSAGTSWLIAFVYLLLIFLLLDLGKAANHFFHFINKETLYGISHANWKTFFAITGCMAILLFVGNLNYRHKRRIYIPIETEKRRADAPPLRIVAMSDLHLGYTISGKELSEWIRLINAENPDLVLIGGDLIDNRLKPVQQYELDKELLKINAPLGVYACTGNHEFIAGIENISSFFANANITLLRDSVAKIENINIVGRDDYSNHRRKPLRQLVENEDMENFTILLDHQPQHLNEAVDADVDFQFSGHTHRGQVIPFSWITDKIYELSHGYLKKGNTHFYVSSGLGIWGGKFRIGTQSEYVVIDISGKSGKP